MAYNLYEGQCPVIGKLDNYHPGRRNYIRFFVDLADNSWFAGAVQMSVSPANSQPDEKTEEKSLRASNSHSPHKGTDASKSGGNGKAAPQTPTITDEQLLESYRNGNKAAFAQLVERYQRELFHFLVRFLGDRTAAEDVFQESFLQVHQSASQFDPTRRFRPWLFTIAANKARDLMRSQARRPTNPLQATISPGDDESGQYIDLMEATNPTPNGAPTPCTATHRVRLRPAVCQSTDRRNVASTAPHSGIAVHATTATAHARAEGLSGISSAREDATSTPTSTGRTIPSRAIEENRAPK